MESRVWRSGIGEQECGEPQGISSGMSPELSMESRMWHDRGPSHPRLESEFVFRRV